MTTFTILLIDKNDNPPRFNSSEYRVLIPELAQVGFALPLYIQVEDKDEVRHAHTQTVKREYFPLTWFHWHILYIQMDEHVYSTLTLFLPKRPMSKKKLFAETSLRFPISMNMTFSPSERSHCTPSLQQLWNKLESVRHQRFSPAHPYQSSFKLVTLLNLLSWL